MSKITIIELPESEVPWAQGVVNDMIKLYGADKHPVLTELRRDVFRGGRTWVLNKDGIPTSIHCSRIGKRKKNKFEPYANWYGAYTLPAERRKGYAYRLYSHVEAEAVKAGCRRIRSLAGSSAGLGLHLALRHKCWGLTPDNEVWVDSPLPFPGWEEFYEVGEVPPQVPRQTPLSLIEVHKYIRDGLRYDHAD